MRTRPRRTRPDALVLCVVIAVLSCAGENGGRERAETTASIGPLAPIRADVRAYVRDRHVPGLSVALSIDGELVWAEGFGYADLERDRPVTPRTRFRIASISKALTGVVAAALWEAGLLDLDAPIEEYVPSFPGTDPPITARLLGGHLSGLPHYGGGEPPNTKHYASVTEALASFRDRRPLHEPGERYSYSSFGVVLLSAAIEGASGLSFIDATNAWVLEPLGMSDTVLDDRRRADDARTVFYEIGEDGTVRVAPEVDSSDVWAAAGFLSTAENLVRFGNGVLDRAVVGERAVDLLFTPMTTSAGEETGYGLGFSVWRIDGRRAVGHAGGHVGSRAILIVLPDDGLVLAMLTNVHDKALIGFAEETATRCLDVLAHGPRSSRVE